MEVEDLEVESEEALVEAWVPTDPEVWEAVLAAPAD
jgi:hypothetical protein